MILIIIETMMAMMMLVMVCKANASKTSKSNDGKDDDGKDDESSHQYRDMGICQRCCMEKHGMTSKQFQHATDTYYLCDADKAGIVERIITCKTPKDINSSVLFNSLHDAVNVPFEMRKVHRQCPYYAEHIVYDLNVGKIRRKWIQWRMIHRRIRMDTTIMLKHNTIDIQY